ncbi:MAG: hypothetical protein F4244_12155 [Gammaproteobacteria bacterium]|nr:hypothetical protein [Gammaproteobacteria bacterium]
MHEELPTAPVQSRTDDDSESRIRKVATVVYALQAAGIIFGGIPFIAGVVINYVKRSEARGTWLESHFRWQIRTFWFGLLWLAAGTVVAIPTILLMGLGYLVFGMVAGAVLVWGIYRIVRGWLRLSDGSEMYSESRPA